MHRGLGERHLVADGVAVLFAHASDEQWNRQRRLVIFELAQQVDHVRRDRARTAKVGPLCGGTRLLR